MKPRKPSSRTHRMRPMEGINLTPFIDMITCLMFFLLMFAAVIPIAIINAPLPKIASTADEVKKAIDDKNKLELTVHINNQTLRVVGGDGGERSFQAVNGKFAFEEFHKFLVQTHQKRPNSKEITLMPTDDVRYETIIEVMDASRELGKTDPGYQVVPPEVAQKPEAEQFNRLFPEVSIGGV